MSKPKADYMKKILQLSLIALLVVLMAAVVMLSGCVSDERQNNAPPQFGNRNGFANLTAEERQQMSEQRMKEAVSACEGKAAGDSCIIQSPRGNMTSTCELQNSTLLCAGDFGRGGPGAPPGNWTRPQN